MSQQHFCRDKRLRVLKFGGTSVKDIGRMHHVAEIIERRLQEGPAVVVVSAMGDTTDYLVNLAQRCATEPEGREIDQLLATGEQVSISLLAMSLQARGIKTRSLTGAQAGIVTDNVHSNARVVSVDKERLLEAFEANEVVIIAGFQGVTSGGDTTTLGRGGSDTTAVAVAAAIEAESCDIYTDVDGVYTADPNLIKGASLLSEISFEDASEMSRLGAQVIHPRAVELADKYKVPLRVRNTFKPDNQGTVIHGDQKMEIYQSVTGVAVDKGQAIVSACRLPESADVVARILSFVAEHNIVIDLVSQNLRTAGSLCFTVNQADLARTIKLLNEVTSEFPTTEVSFDGDASKVSIIGAGISGRPGVAAKAFACLAKHGINVKLASTGDRRLTFVVSANEAVKAASALHDAFDLHTREHRCLQKTS